MKNNKKYKDRYSILVPSLDKCFVCGQSPVHLHEVFYGRANREKSIEDGCVIPLCPMHHNMSNQGVHYNNDLDDYLKKFAEKKWIEKYTTDDMTKEEKINAFIKRFGRNYLL